MRLEKWFISNLDDSQRNIIVQSIDKSIAVRGAAGSGKTNLAIHRALQAKDKGSYAIVIFTIALKRMIAYGMDALGLDKERIAYEWAWTHRGFDMTGDVYWKKVTGLTCILSMICPSGSLNVAPRIQLLMALTSPIGSTIDSMQLSGGDAVGFTSVLVMMTSMSPTRRHMS